MKEISKQLQYGDEVFFNYEVSKKGEIKSLPRWIVDKNGQEMFIKGKILKQRLDDNGEYYFCECARDVGGRKTIYAHKAVFDTFSKKRSDYVSHKDGNTRNNDFKNLYPVTHSELQIRNSLKRKR